MIARSHLVGMFAIVLVACGFSVALYGRLPDPAPMHWNLHGVVDGWGPRWEAAVLMPAIGLGMIGLMAGLPLLGPFRRNFERFRTTYGRICVAIVTALLAFHLIALLKGIGRSIEIGATMSIVVGLLLAVIGNWLGKVRRNLHVGIRTPWTLANDAVWERTHRAGARFMVSVGLVSALAGIVAPDWLCFAVLMGGLGAFVVWAALYSLYWYRKLGERDELTSSADA